jgi:protein tyrosine phosphatase (PTP) superfamily phosphohydrolase (DUF442 family)
MRIRTVARLMPSEPTPPVDAPVERAPRVADPPLSARRRWRGLSRVLLGLVAFLVVGNVAILGASVWARHSSGASGVTVPAEVAAIHNFEAVDQHLWRGGAPDQDAYEALAAAGVTTIIDLRAEHDIHVPHDLLDELGLTLVAIPMRDGQAPSPAQVARFMDAVAAADGPVYVHCGAGVGRTGTMVAAYRVARGQSPSTAVRANLAVGPPSLEQIAFAASLVPGAPAERPNAVVVALSRTLDAPRRGWKALEGLL